MDSLTPAGLIPISDCAICSRLADVETSFSKYGWEEMTRALPAEAWQLEPAEPIDTERAQNHHIKRCPICGTLYRYDWSYEYLVNGSEDEEALARLAPSEARRFFSDADYETRMKAMAGWLDHPCAQTRRFAARCLAIHYRAQGERAQIDRLLTSSDTAIAEGARAALATWPA
jgi:hypothetical protein